MTVDLSLLHIGRRKMDQKGERERENQANKINFIFILEKSSEDFRILFALVLLQGLIFYRQSC